MIDYMAERETKGLLTLIAPSSVLNHFGMVVVYFGGRCSWSLTMLIEQSLNVY